MPLGMRKITPDMLAADPFRLTTIDFEKDMSAAPVVALSLIAVNAAAYAWELAVGALRSKAAIIAAGAVVGDRVFSGESWRLATGMFLHANFSHLFGNCAALYMLGMAAEQAWGRTRTLAIYVAGGLASSLLAASMQPKPSVGASGAIFGLFGVVVVFFARHRAMMPARDRRIGAALLAWGLLQLGLGLFDPIVDNWGHLGGLAAGFAIGLFLPSRFRQPEPSAGA